MKQLGYYILRYWIAFGLFFYYKKIKVSGLGNIPQDKPVLFLSNHQNALLDVLLVATCCGRKPWFLTRADVFKNRFFRPLFEFLQMLPIYRIRDGKASLAKNEAIFHRCGALLNQEEAILIFPEANHNLRRKVRPLSKGFTRLLFSAIEQNSVVDIHLIPVGQNYQSPTKIGDSVGLYFGMPIRVQEFMADDRNKSIQNLRNTVSESLKQLTTHIANEEEYEDILEKLDRHQADFSNPIPINEYLNDFDVPIENVPKHSLTVLQDISGWLFYLFNLPIILTWKLLLKPKVPEQEFMGTYLFGFGMVAYSMVYSFLLVWISYVLDVKTACLFVFGHAALNFMLIKIGVSTSFHQRK